MRQASLPETFFKVAVRVLLLTAIFTLVGFAIGLFCGIGAAVLFGLIRHVQPDMTMAYRLVALPFGIIAFVITFFVMLFVEIRYVRNPLKYSRPFSARRTS